MSRETVFLTRARVREIEGRRARARLGLREFWGTVEVTPRGESRYEVVLVDFEADWELRKGYPQVRLSAGMVEGLELV